MKFFVRRRAGLVTAITMVVLVAVTAILLFAPHDAGAVRVTMKRVIFEGAKRTELLTIVNNSAEEQAYRLGWRNMRMTEDKSLIHVKEGDSLEGLHPAEDMVRFSPRRVVLPPGASQQVRLMLRRPKDLPDGEYRSHFWIQPEDQAEKFVPDEAKKSDKPSIQIKMLTGMTVPVFVRSGNLTATVNIADIKATPSAEGLKVTFILNRDGSRSVYGDLAFFCNGSDKPQKEVRGIAVYTDVNRRNMSFDVPYPAEGGAAACSQIKVKYTSEEEDPLFKGAVMAEAATGG